MKRFLIFHISEVSGHRKAAEAIREALEYRFPQQTAIRNIDALKYFHPVAHRVINHLYFQVISSTPFIWGAIYDKPSVAAVLDPVKRLIHANKIKAMSHLYDEFRPQAIVCTQAFPCGIVADFKRERKIRVPLIAVVTDFHPHRYWVYDEVDYYTVATPDAQKTLCSLGVDSAKVKTVGIPIARGFTSVKKDRVQLARKLGLDPALPTVLIMGGGSGLGPIEKVVSQLDRLPEALQIIVLCGKNKRLLETLQWMRPSLAKKIALYGYVDFVNECMLFSDILITKPGGITIAEALNMDVAIVVIKPIPGQEENNTEVLMKEGIAVRAGQLDDIPRLVKQLLDDPRTLEKYKQQGLKLSKPDSADQIVEIITDASQHFCL